MKIRNAIGYSIMAAIVGFSSCDTYYYYPTRQHVLDFKGKGDATVAVGMDENQFGSFKVGYSITDNLGLISDFKPFDWYAPEDNMKYAIDDYLWDNELVIYKKYLNCIYPAINLGCGFGRINRNEDYYRLSINRQFVQPSVGFSNDFFDVAISSRFSRVNHDLHQLRYDLHTEQTVEDYYDFQDVGIMNFYFFEPAITVGVGYKFVKLRYQVVLIKKLSSGNIRYIDENSCVALNFTFNIDKLLTKQK